MSNSKKTIISGKGPFLYETDLLLYLTIGDIYYIYGNYMKENGSACRIIIEFMFIIFLKIWGEKMKGIFRGILNRFQNRTANIPEKYKEELKHEILLINIKRERALSIVLSIFVSIIICTILFAINSTSIDRYVSRVSLHIHILLLAIPMIFILLTRTSVNIYKSKKKSLEIYHLTIIGLVIALCALIAINNELANQRPFAFIIAIFSIASIILLNSIERYTIFILSYVIYVAGTAYLIRDLVQVFESILFTLPLVTLASMVSAINYSSYVSDYVNNKLMHEKNLQLDSLYRITEEMLKERTKQLNEVKEMEQIRTAFFANISHELRTPLNLIFSAEQLLDNIYQKEEIQKRTNEIKRYNGIIKQNCYRLIRLIGNLIDITKIDAGYYRPEFKNYDIVKVVEDITLSVADYIEDKNINLIFDTEFEEKIVTCDVYQMERIMLNLLSNAVKFTPSGGEIYVSLSEQENNVVVKVKDSGIGIPETMKEKVFERFVQVDKSTTRNREGSGIGLSLVKALVEMHGGNITLISEEGKGCEFIIVIPMNLIKNAAEEEVAVSESHENVEKIKIEFSDIYN